MGRSLVCDSTDALTRREAERLELLARGLTNVGIASHMHVALPTVAMHLVNARKKLGAHTREQAVAQAVKRKLIEP